MIKFHFLNVGHGDTTIVDLPDDYLMVVDFNRSNELDEDTAKELSNVYEINFSELKDKKDGYYKYISKYYDIPLDDPLIYLEENIKKKDIFRYVQTHPDVDHLSGFKALINNFEITNFWDTDHKNIVKTDFTNESDREDWECYLEYRKYKKKVFYRSSKEIITESNLYPYKIYAFHPTKESLKIGDLHENPNPNYFSYLILIDYCGFKTVLGGDVTQNYWKDLWQWLDKYKSIKELFKDIYVLKASHHGRKSGRCGWEENGIYNREFLNWMDPEYVIISIGKKPENCDATEWYRKRPGKYNRSVLTTRWYGTICISYDGSIPFNEERIILETRFDRKDKSEHIEELKLSFIKSEYKFKIGAKISAKSDGPFREEYKSNGRALIKNICLKFYIKKTNIKIPYEVKWRVVNTGEEARIAEDLRGKIEDGRSDKTKIEHTKYKGTHYMDCFAIKDGFCIAKDKFFVNIK